MTPCCDIIPALTQNHIVVGPTQEDNLAQPTVFTACASWIDPNPDIPLKLCYMTMILTFLANVVITISQS